MKLQINGEPVELENGMTLSTFLRAKDIRPNTVVVEHNATIPDRSTWDTLTLADGDVLEIVKFMGGGRV
ncbi:MAG: sulfur carrier protein ThiS [Ethanoligenens sp.]